MGYVSLDEAKNFLGIGTNDDDELLANLIGVAQNLVEGYCGRVFAASAPTTRRFDCAYPTVSDRGQVLHLDGDLARVTEVVNGNGEVMPDDTYVTLPEDGPFFALALRLSSGKVWTFVDDREQALQVTGYWAYGRWDGDAGVVVPPDAVVHATKEILGWLYRSYDRSLSGEGSAPDTTRGGIPLPPVAVALLEVFRRVSR
ncbi:MAG: phage gp6-like head-tail connector protein [Chloroflexaceae bacterium]|nr:phage gp6-like head-tail connector protein [Chloroflexaceae bacterium]